MNFRQTFLSETLSHTLIATVASRSSVALAAILSIATFAGAETVGSQVPIESVSELADEKELTAFVPDMKQLTAAFNDQTQCRVRKDLGVSGLIAMSDSEFAGPFLAVWWDAKGLLTATLRSANSFPIESFTLRDGLQSELVLLRRGTTIYAYAVESGVDDPLIAVDFASGSDMVAGALVGKNYTGEGSAISSVVANPTLTGDLLQKQPGTELVGDWDLENHPNSLGGAHLVNQGDDPNASVAVKVENLLPGTHELWIRYAGEKSRTEEAEVTVEGFGKPVSLVVNQRISGGVWLPLGRFVTESVTSSTIRLAPGHPGSGSLSLDAVHAVWSEWKGKNRGQLPSALEAGNTRDSLASETSELNGPGDESQMVSPDNESSSQSKGNTVPVPDGSRSVIYVHSALGSDSFDGRRDKPQAGAWFSVRGGPKRSIGAALKSVSKTTRVIELHLDGKVGSPAAYFQNLENVSIVLVPGPNGASFETPGLPPDLPPSLLPPLPVRP